MLKLLSIFVILTVVHCDPKCPAFAAFDGYPHQTDIATKILGKYNTVYTSSTVVNCGRVDCQKNSNNEIEAHLYNIGCCGRQYNFQFGSNGANYTIGPIAGYVNSCPYLVDEPGSMKLLGTMGSRPNQCIIVAVCQQFYYALNVACEGTAPLLFDVVVVLSKVLNILQLTDFLTLKSVSQSCEIPEGTCPGFN